MKLERYVEEEKLKVNVNKDNVMKVLNLESKGH